MPPKLNRERALFVLGKIDEIREFSARVRDGTAMVTDSSSPSGSPGAV